MCELVFFTVQLTDKNIYKFFSLLHFKFLYILWMSTKSALSAKPDSNCRAIFTAILRRNSRVAGRVEKTNEMFSKLWFMTTWCTAVIAWWERERDQSILATACACVRACTCVFGSYVY